VAPAEATGFSGLQDATKQPVDVVGDGCQASRCHRWRSGSRPTRRFGSRFGIREGGSTLDKFTTPNGRPIWRGQLQQARQAVGGRRGDRAGAAFPRSSIRRRHPGRENDLAVSVVSRVTGLWMARLRRRRPGFELDSQVHVQGVSKALEDGQAGHGAAGLAVDLGFLAWSG
jgi:hypothetical protein